MPLWLLANPVTSLLGGVSLLLLLGIGVQTYRLSLADTAVAVAQKQAADINRIYAENDAKNERARADQEAKNQAELSTIQARTLTLQSTLNQKQLDYTKVSGQLRAMLANAPQEDKAPLGRAMRAFLAGLRNQQSEWHQAASP